MVARLPGGTLVAVHGQVRAYRVVRTPLEGEEENVRYYMPAEQVQAVDYLQEWFEPSYAVSASGRSRKACGRMSICCRKACLCGKTSCHSPWRLGFAGTDGDAVAGQRNPHHRRRAGEAADPVHGGDPPGKRYGVVISNDLRDRLYLRAGPGKDTRSLGRFYSGAQVEILGEKGDFYQVRIGFDEGYMGKEFIWEVRVWNE